MTKKNQRIANITRISLSMKKLQGAIDGVRVAIDGMKKQNYLKKRVTML